MANATSALFAGSPARLAVLVAPGIGRIRGCSGDSVGLRRLLADRVANQDACVGEIMIRLPRGWSVDATGDLRRLRGNG